MKNYPKVALKVNSRQYNKLVDLANRCIVSITANSNYTTPSPSLSNVQLATTAVENSLALWGPEHGRGSTEDLLDLRSKAVTLHQLLKALSEYVQNTAELAAGNDYEVMAAILSTSGFALALQPVPNGVLQAVQNLHRVVDPSINLNAFKSRWKRPLNTKNPGDIDTYAVYKGTTPDFSAATQVALTSKAEYSEVNNSGVAVTWFYWIIAYNPAGAGAVSEVLMVRLLAA